MNIPGHCPSISIFHSGEIFMMMDNDNTGIDNAYVIETKRLVLDAEFIKAIGKRIAGKVIQRVRKYIAVETVLMGSSVHVI
jgi:hypothetical protein